MVVVGYSSSDMQGMVAGWDMSHGSSQATHLFYTNNSYAPVHGLAPTSSSSFAASSSSSLHHHHAISLWMWNNPLPHSHIYPSEHIGPLASTSDGAYLLGGGLSGRMHVWELKSGHLIRSWPAHEKMITTLLLTDDESLVVSGGDDGFVNVWPLVRILDIAEPGTQMVFALHRWAAHSLSITGVACGVGACNAVVASCSLDCTVKLWALGLGTHLRTIKFLTCIHAVALDPTESKLYAGGSDGKIYIVVLKLDSRKCNQNESTDGIIGSLFDHRGPVSSLAFSSDGVTLFSASEDCTVRVWDTSNNCVIRIFEHNRGPLHGILVFSLLELDPCSNGDLNHPELRSHASYSESGDGPFRRHDYCKQVNKSASSKANVDALFNFSPFYNSASLVERRIKDCEDMKNNLTITEQDHKQTLDMLEKMIYVYQRISKFSTSNAIAENDNHEDGRHAENVLNDTVQNNTRNC